MQNELELVTRKLEPLRAYDPKKTKNKKTEDRNEPHQNYERQKFVVKDKIRDYFINGRIRIQWDSKYGIRKRIVKLLHQNGVFSDQNSQLEMSVQFSVICDSSILTFVLLTIKTLTDVFSLTSLQEHSTHIMFTCTTYGDWIGWGQ